MDSPAPDRFARYRDLIAPDTIRGLHATVVGCGAIGRQVALQLAVMGVGNLTLIDFDRVATENLGAQGFRHEDLGDTKVNATRILACQFNPECHVEPHATRFARRFDLGQAVFSCVDDMDARGLIFRTAFDRHLPFIDTRMASLACRVLTVPADHQRAKDHYESTLFRQDEGSAGTCTAKTTFYCASVAAGMAVNQLVQMLRKMPVEVDFTLNLQANELLVPIVRP